MTYVQKSILDEIAEGEKRKQQGMQQAIDHANAVTPDWSNKARQFIINRFLPLHKRFMTEDIRSFAAMHDFELPCHGRAWGGVVAALAKDLLIINIGTDKVKNPKAHRTPATVWERNCEKLIQEGIELIVK